MLSISQCATKLVQVEEELTRLDAALIAAHAEVDARYTTLFAKQHARRAWLTAERDRQIQERSGVGDYVVERLGQYLTRSGGWDRSPDSHGIKMLPHAAALMAAREWSGATVITKAQFEEAQYALRDQMKKNA